MKKIILLFILFISCHFCYGQRYTLTSYKYTIKTAPYIERKDYIQYSTIIVDLNKLTIEVHRKDKTFYFKIVEVAPPDQYGRHFECVDITGGRYLPCKVNYTNMSSFLGRANTFQLWFHYENLNAYYLIDGN